MESDKKFYIIPRERGGARNTTAIVLTGSTQEVHVKQRLQFLLGKTADTEFSIFADVQDAHEDLFPRIITLTQPPEEFAVDALLTLAEFLGTFKGPGGADVIFCCNPPYGRVVQDTPGKCTILVEIACFATRRSSAVFRPTGGLLQPAGGDANGKKPHGLERAVSTGDATVTPCCCVSHVPCDLTLSATGFQALYIQFCDCCRSSCRAYRQVEFEFISSTEAHVRKVSSVF